MSITLYQQFRVNWGDKITAEVIFTKTKENVIYRSAAETNDKDAQNYEISNEERKKKIELRYQSPGYSYVRVTLCEPLKKILNMVLGDVEIFAYVYNYKDTKKLFKISSYAMGKYHKVKVNIAPTTFKGIPAIAIRDDIETIYRIEGEELLFDEE